MNKEETFDEMIKDGALAIMSVLSAAIAIGDYKKANEILDFLSVKESDNGKINKDIMIV